METYELENEIYAAMTGHEELMSILPDGANSIYHFAAPSVLPNRYPIIVYSPVSDVPALSGDNKELAHRVTIRIHIIAAQKSFDDKFLAASRCIKQIMQRLKFFRQQTTPFFDDGKAMIIFDWIRSVSVNGNIRY